MLPNDSPLVTMLLQRAMSYLQETRANPPPLVFGRYRLTSFDPLRPPTPASVPVAIVWRQEQDEGEPAA